MRHLWPALLAVALATVSAVSADGPTEFPLYVGQGVCRECHPQVDISDSHTSVDIPKHNRTLDLLSREEARSIAALSGIVERAKDSLICLYCHATAADEGARWTAESFSIEDGVQCEACHGAGSAHVESVRSDHSLRSGDPRLLIRRGDLDDCGGCHVERPSHRAVLEEGFTLSPADDLYKTPVDLAVSPDGERLYVVCENSDSMIVVDRTGGAVVGEVPVGKRPHGVAVSRLITL